MLFAIFGTAVVAVVYFVAIVNFVNQVESQLLRGLA